MIYLKENENFDEILDSIIPEINKIQNKQNLTFYSANYNSLLYEKIQEIINPYEDNSENKDDDETETKDEDDDETETKDEDNEEQKRGL